MMDQVYHMEYLGFSDPKADHEMLYYPTGHVRMNLMHEINPKMHEEFPPMYTMREKPFKGLLSAYQIYMLSDTEYEAAMKLFGSWNIWTRYTQNKQFLEGPKGNTRTWVGLNAWREEKDIQREASSFSQLREAAELGNVQAMKAIWDFTKKSKAGRPSKKAVAEAAQQAAAASSAIKDDLKRIKLVANNGKQTANS